MGQSPNYIGITPRTAPTQSFFVPSFTIFFHQDEKGFDVNMFINKYTRNGTCLSENEHGKILMYVLV